MLGPSGSGKTTTLPCHAGFEIPDSGQVWLDGREITSLPPHRRSVNTVFQSYALFPFLDVANNVGFGLKYLRVTRVELRWRVARALELVRLTGYERRRPAQLSGGQQQRVELARALVLRPSVLLLDEPLGALDAKLRRVLQVELKALQGAARRDLRVRHPERVVLHPFGTSGPNHVPGMVERIVFLGSASQVFLTLAPGVAIQALIGNVAGLTTWSQGTAVNAELLAESLRVLPEHDESSPRAPSAAGGLSEPDGQTSDDHRPTLYEEVR